MGGPHSPNIPMEITNRSRLGASKILLPMVGLVYQFFSFFAGGPENTETLAQLCSSPPGPSKDVKVMEDIERTMHKIAGTFSVL